MISFHPFAAAFPLVATGGALASALSQPSLNSFASSNTTISSPASSPTSSPDPNAPVCGAGFTYCGYILRDHKNFKEDDIVNAYCAAHKDNCVNGTARTDPLQALYICLPPNANPLEAWADSSGRVMAPHGTSHNHNDKQNQHQKKPAKLSLRVHQADHQQQNKNNDNNNAKRTHHYLPNLHIISEEENGRAFEKRQAPTTVQHPQAPHSSSSSQEPPSAEAPQAPQTPWPSQSGSSTGSSSSSSSSSSSNRSDTGGGNSGGNSGSDGGDSSNSCASSLTIPGNKIELLCSCGRQCLNPLSDHIARCDGPCSS
ncbi:hypothetical protein C8A01DRAFT_36182 [Parachaetomium inaequale]|uniref:Uncharacterized protein n=1 Tax=Parachaetomium inaequale TaxID=2588326 RepID=A0AAN6PJS6_9PEZI|nr:hypothetical protein C8A01DRAFT_36182 [Parachaetomium inaequale]